MKTPVRYGVYAMMVSLGLNIALVFVLAHAGLALATSLGAFFNAALLLVKLKKDKIYQPAAGWWLFLSRVLLAAGAMSAVLYYFVDAEWWNHWNSLTRVIHLGKWIGIGLAIYTLTLLLTGLRLKHLAGQMHGQA
jgi:putative peptidoglycan lipid II flippase